MRMNIEAYNLDSLRKIVRKLFTENRRLKQQLKSANISFESEDPFSEQIEKKEEYDPDQGGRIISPYITEDMVRGQPRIYEALPSFLDFVGDDVLAGHNVKFDYGFLSIACMQSRFKVPELLFDTMALARYYPETGSRKLTALVKAAGVEPETAHRALGDARMTAKLILATNEKRKKKK